MPFISTALAVGLGVSAAGSIAGGVLANKGANAQAKAAETSAQMSVDEQRRQFDITQKNEQPWIQAGQGSLSQLEYLMGSGGAGNAPAGMSASDYGSLQHNFEAADFQTDSGYEFRLKQGIDALQRSAAAKGTVLSGGTLKALTQYNQDFASNEYSNAYNRFQSDRSTKYNQLASIAELGQQTAVQLGNQGQQNAQSIGNTIIGGATSAAAARASGYQAWGNTIQNVANTPLNWMMLSQMEA